MNTSEPPELHHSQSNHSTDQFQYSNDQTRSFVDTSSLKIFVRKQSPVNTNDSLNKQKNTNNIHNSDSSSNCDEKEHLDKISIMATGDENCKKDQKHDFMTPKKESKNVECDTRVFQLYNKDKNEEMTHSANRLKTKNNNLFCKSYSSFTGLPFTRKASDSYSFNNNTFNDELSERNLMRELGIQGKLDPSSGGNSTKMIENRPGSFILTQHNKNQRSLNSNSNNYVPQNNSNEN